MNIVKEYLTKRRRKDTEFDRSMAVRRLVDVIDNIDGLTTTQFKEALQLIGEESDLREVEDITNLSWMKRRWDDK